MMEWRVPLADLDYGPEEEQAVLDVVRRRWLTMGALTGQFEAEFAQLVGTKHALAISNATQALHLACLALGIGPGDEVIAPSLTFVASTNAVLYTGARVRFTDIAGVEELNISPEAIEKNITPATKAILVVHYGGFPCRMEAVMEIAARHGLGVIEDAAHAPGASLAGKALGTLGDAGCFSFFSNKNLSTGEGGMLVTNRDDVAEKVRLMRSHGMTTLTWDRHRGHAHSYDVVELGYNYRIDEIRSALGLAQLHKLEDNNGRRKAITVKYWQAFNGTGLDLPFRDSLGQPGGSEPAYHIFPILLPRGTDREQFIGLMKEAGIQTSIHYPPIHQFSYYRKHYAGVSLPLTEDAAGREVTLPLYPTMSAEQQQLVISTVCRVLDEIDPP
jgi:dTDP-4-amino-4,6-dideoxygalactose transaminase